MTERPRIYIADASSLIGMVKRYPRGIFPSVWERFEGLIGSKQVISSDKVFEEISRKKDEVYDWCVANRKIFVQTTDEIDTIAGKLNDNHRPAADVGVKDKADPFLIAVGIQKGDSNSGQAYAILTEEAGDRPNKIPRIAAQHDVPALNLVGMFGDQGWKF